MRGRVLPRCVVRVLDVYTVGIGCCVCAPYTRAGRARGPGIYFTRVQYTVCTGAVRNSRSASLDICGARAELALAGRVSGCPYTIHALQHLNIQRSTGGDSRGGPGGSQIDIDRTSHAGYSCTWGYFSLSAFSHCRAVWSVVGRARPGVCLSCPALSRHAGLPRVPLVRTGWVGRVRPE